MKIIQIVHRLGNPSAGPSYSVRELAVALAAQRNDVSIMCLPPAPEFWPDTVRLKTFDGPLARSLGYSGSLRRTLRERAMEPSILCFHGLWRPTNLYTWGLPTGRQAKVVVSTRGMASAYTFAKHRLARSLWWQFLQKPALAHVDCFHATAAAECDEIRAADLKGPIAIVPNGIDIPEISPAAAPGRRTLLFLSRINHKKGLDMLLPAWRRLQDRQPDWDMVIAGPLEGEYADMIQAEAERLGCERISFPGQLLGADKARAFMEADVFVLPTYSENFGLVVAEALAHGVPVVTTRGAPWEGLQGNRCGWWTSIDEDAITAALAEAMTTPRGELGEMGARGRAWMERDYSWSHVGEMMQVTYEWLLRGATRPSWVE